MDGFWDGLGTELVVLLVGLLVGGGAGSAITWRISNNKKTMKQSQKAGKGSTQTQVGRDFYQERDK
jgi:hypothetical protein